MNAKKRLKEIAKIIQAVDDRCMSADGDVTNTLDEMTVDEIREIYMLAALKDDIPFLDEKDPDSYLAQDSKNPLVNAELDEKGFVFLDKVNRPYLCRLWNNKPWIFYWHPDNHWVSLREVTQSEIFSFPRNLTDEQQAGYHKAHKKYHEEKIKCFVRY